MTTVNNNYIIYVTANNNTIATLRTWDIKLIKHKSGDLTQTLKCSCDINTALPDLEQRAISSPTANVRINKESPLPSGSKVKR